MIYNYHTHTFRCNHASGTEEEFINQAIAGGIKRLGFSDHMPFKFPDGYESIYRVPTALAEDYFSTLYALREKYKNDLTIYIGFEMEYYPAYFDEMLENARNYGAEYLILGQHFLYNEHPDGIPSPKKTDVSAHLKAYVSNVIDAMKTGVFTYVAHPDIFHYVGDETTYRKEMKKICIASRELNIPLEINFLGMRDGRHYPNETFWKIAAKEQSPVTFGCDAHHTPHVCDILTLEKAKKLVDRLNLNYIGEPTIKFL